MRVVIPGWPRVPGRSVVQFDLDHLEHPAIVDPLEQTHTRRLGVAGIRTEHCRWRQVGLVPHTFLEVFEQELLDDGALQPGLRPHVEQIYLCSVRLVPRPDEAVADRVGPWRAGDDRRPGSVEVTGDVGRSGDSLPDRVRVDPLHNGSLIAKSGEVRRSAATAVPISMASIGQRSTSTMTSSATAR